MKRDRFYGLDMTGGGPGAGRANARTRTRENGRTVEAVATVWACSVATVYRLARARQVRRRRVLGRVLFNEADVQRVAREREAELAALNNETAEVTVSDEAAVVFEDDEELLFWEEMLKFFLQTLDIDRAANAADRCVLVRRDRLAEAEDEVEDE